MTIKIIFSSLPNDTRHQGVSAGGVFEKHALDTISKFPGFSREFQSETRIECLVRPRI